MSYYNHKLAYISVAIIIFLTILYFINAISISGDSLIVNFNLKIIHTDNLTTFGFFTINSTYTYYVQVSESPFTFLQNNLAYIIVFIFIMMILILAIAVRGRRE